MGTPETDAWMDNIDWSNPFPHPVKLPEEEKFPPMKIPLGERAELIRLFEDDIQRYTESLRQLYHDGLTKKEYNKLVELVMLDGKPHTLY